MPMFANVQGYICGRQLCLQAELEMQVELWVGAQRETRGRELPVFNKGHEGVKPARVNGHWETQQRPVIADILDNKRDGRQVMPAR